MTIRNRETLLNLHYFLHLNLSWAAVVDSFSCDGNSTMPVNRLLLVFNRAGDSECYISNQDTNQKFIMDTGCLYFVPCHQLAYWKITPSISFVSLHFNLDLFYGFDVFKNYKRCEMVKDFLLVCKIKQLICAEDEFISLCHINKLIYSLCANWLSAPKIHVQKNIDTWRKYEKVLSFIKTYGDATTTVAILADINCMNKDVFSRTFTKDIGITPKVFISNAIIRKASEMLLTSNSSIHAVADKLNFSSAYYFSHFFKKHTGMTPKSFQKYHTSQNLGVISD